jgi:hypothetical protein
MDEEFPFPLPGVDAYKMPIGGVSEAKLFRFTQL